MREIKFRAWDKKRNVMWEPIAFIRLLQYLFFENFPNATAYQEIKHHFNDIVWLEYTGLKDSQGKEIYEGDVIQWAGLEVQNGKQIYPLRKRAVGMTADAFRDSFIDDCFHTQNLLEHGKNLEIIGNIYENPDLIKNDK